MEASDTTPNEDTPDVPSQQTIQELIASEIQKALAGTAPDDDAPVMPQVPKLDHNPETPDEVSKLAGMFAEFRKEVHALRAELRQRAGQQVQIAGPTETIEDRTNRRLELIAQNSHYCPGCGELGTYPQKCTGPKGGHPHPAIEMVSTDELGGDPQDHTAAPATDPDGYPALAA